MQIDWWTLGLQTVNVLVLVWLLQHFFFRPVKAVIQARRAAADSLLAEAQAARDTAQASTAALEARRQDFVKEGEAVLATAHAAALTDRTAVLEQAKQEAARVEAAAHAVLDREREIQRRELETQAGELAVTMARRLLALLPEDRVTAALLEILAKDLAALPAATRQDMATTGPIVVTTATPLSPEEQASWRNRLLQVLGAETEISFKDDPGLIAGVELLGPHTLLRRHWRADLERLGRALTPDRQAAHV